MKWTLVTGGRGFIGTNLCKKLLEDGKYVIVLDNHITSTVNQKNIFSAHPHYRFIKHDITQEFPNELFSPDISIETIYHLACPTGVANLLPLSLEMALTCSIGTKNVLEYARIHNADIVYASSSEVYGNPKIFPQKEDYTGNVSPVGVRSPYEEGKRFSETLINIFAKKYNLRTKIIRIFNTYGPFMSPTDTRVIPRFIQQIKFNQPLTITGDGTQTRTFCFIDDLIQGISLIQKYGQNGEIYNLGSNYEISIYALAKKIILLKGNTRGITFRPQFFEDHTRRLPALEKVYQLGWRMKVNLDEGLKKTLQWYGL